MQKRWQVRGGLTVVSELPALEHLLLFGRGVASGGEKNFFEPKYDEVIHDPYRMPDMKKAVDRIVVAKEKDERVLVYGDYDVDGITSSAILLTTLHDIGIRADVYLPHRNEDGYGLNKDRLAEKIDEFDLLITVDCGITATDEVKWLREKKKDVIIVDHHTIPDEKPAAVAIIHPQIDYPFDDLCGAGTTWKLATALVRHDELGKSLGDDYEKWLLDLAALGTLADMVSLTGENRAIVQFGIEVVRRTKRLGLQRLLESQRIGQKDVTAEVLSWRIIPRMNAAGRMDHAQPALDLLLTRSVVEAERLVTILNEVNTLRQGWTEKIMKQAEEMIDNEQSVLVASQNEWPAGVVGLAAGRLARKYNKPAVVVGSNGVDAVGSARSPKGLNVLEILKAGEDHVMKLGGHANAAGFSLDWKKLDDFTRLVTGTDISSLGESVEIADAVMAPTMIDWGTVDLAQKLAPFGQGNTEPRFIWKNLSLIDWRPVGKTETHAKCSFLVGDRVIDGIGFGLSDAVSQCGEDVDVMGSVNVNEFRGRRTLQIKIDDIASTGTVDIHESDTIH